MNSAITPTRVRLLYRTLQSVSGPVIPWQIQWLEELERCARGEGPPMLAGTLWEKIRLVHTYLNNQFNHVYDGNLTGSELYRVGGRVVPLGELQVRLNMIKIDNSNILHL